MEMLSFKKNLFCNFDSYKNIWSKLALGWGMPAHSDILKPPNHLLMVGDFCVCAALEILFKITFSWVVA
jgi:hypothetical protein